MRVARSRVQGQDDVNGKFLGSNVETAGEPHPARDARTSCTCLGSKVETVEAATVSLTYEFELTVMHGKGVQV